MKNKKIIAVCMDNASAHLTRYAVEEMHTLKIDSLSTHQQKAESMRKSENIMHQKEQAQQATFYKQISEKLMHYPDILLFGPSTAKSELFNLLKDDPQYSEVSFEVLPADYMSIHEEHAFIKNHFSKLQKGK